MRPKPRASRSYMSVVIPTLDEADNIGACLASVGWADERLVVEDCCFSQETIRRRTRTVSEAFWNNVGCS